MSSDNDPSFVLTHILHQTFYLSTSESAKMFIQLMNKVSWKTHSKRSLLRTCVFHSSIPIARFLRNIILREKIRKASISEKRVCGDLTFWPKKFTRLPNHLASPQDFLFDYFQLQASTSDHSSCQVDMNEWLDKLVNRQLMINPMQKNQ